MTESIGLYVHFPFCRSKCPYCHFVSGPEAEGGREAWFGGLEHEASLRGGEKLLVDTLFVGGGTPSLLSPAEVVRLSGILGASFELRLTEFTLEANPDPRDVRHLPGWREAGVSRLSVGAQSFDDRLLALLGRGYAAGDAAAFIRAAKGAGFDSVGVDLMAGVPTETPESLERTLRTALDIGPDHVSLYLMESLEGLPFERLASEHPVDEDAAADAYEFLRGGLEDAGLRRYEISNFAREGAECRHNLKYWRFEPFLGLGPSACSHLAGARWCNRPSPAEWSAALRRNEDPRAEVVRLTPDEALREALVSGLRLARGISVSDLEARFGMNVLERFGEPIVELVRDGLLIREGDRLRIAGDRFLVSNAILSRLI